MEDSKMIDYLEILRLNNLGYSQRTIETTAHCSRHTVREILAEMDKHTIQWPVDDDITNADSNRMLFPYKYESACTLNRTIRTFTVSWQSVVLH